MAQLGGMFDATQVEPQGDYTPIPPGDYTVQIVTSQMVETSNRNGHMLKLELEILDGEHAGRRLYDRLNLENPNRQAVEIAQRAMQAAAINCSRKGCQPPRLEELTQDETTK